jgi:putative lipoic acid-binding regulatory protein
VNEYPQVRGFKAIGSGGEEFTQDMIKAVERVLGVTVPTTQVSVQPSSKGNCTQPSYPL